MINVIYVGIPFLCDFINLTVFNFLSLFYKKNYVKINMLHMYCSIWLCYYYWWKTFYEKISCYQFVSCEPNLKSIHKINCKFCQLWYLLLNVLTLLLIPMLARTHHAKIHMHIKSSYHFPSKFVSIIFIS